MELKNFIASGDIYDVYESDGLAVRVYKDEKYKEKCLYAALTHARCETSLKFSDLKIPVLHEVSLIDGKWAISMDWIEGKTLGQLIDEDPDRADMYIDKLVDIQCEIHEQYMPLLSKLKDKLARQIKSLGQIDEIDMDTVEAVGAAAKNAIFMSKEEIHVHVSRIGGESAEKQHSPVQKPAQCSAAAEALAAELIRLGEDAGHLEPAEHKDVRCGKNSGMGSCGQYFSTWEFVYSLARDLSMYTLYPLAKLCRDETQNVRSLEKVYMAIMPTYTNLLGAYGMRTLRTLAKQFEALIAAHTLTMEEFRYLVDALTFYTNMLAQWTYFYYPWGIGIACFRFDEEHRVYTPRQ